MPDILDKIIERRREDLDRLGPAFGMPVPAVRERSVVPFLQERGAILEIKRASPSRGDIVPDLDVPSLCRRYRLAGASAVSVLTEPHFFKGSLMDLLGATRSDSGSDRPLAFLRKDFLLREEEIEVSYRCGADAVLLIARILDLDRLMAMAAKANELGLRALVEVRTGKDAEKLLTVSRRYPVLAGVNARDLATFTIDLLIPAAMIRSMPVPAVYESGIQSPTLARYAGELGFQGILVGEEAARNPDDAGVLVSAFLGAEADKTGRFWQSLAERREMRRASQDRAKPETAPSVRPLIKICGLTRTEDALFAAELGADLLGFIFAESKRTANAGLVRDVRGALSNMVNLRRPLLVGVITELSSPLATEAVELCREGILDVLQWHGDPLTESPLLRDLPHYRVVRVGVPEDFAMVQDLRGVGSVRFLLDTKVEGLAGGTGTRIPSELLEGPLKEVPDLRSGGLWLAGGLGPDTVGAVLARYRPELVDASSRLEAEPGKKDRAKLEAFFKEIESIQGGLFHDQ